MAITVRPSIADDSETACGVFRRSTTQCDPAWHGAMRYARCFRQMNRDSPGNSGYAPGVDCSSRQPMAA